MRVALVFLTLLGGSAQASPLELYGVGLRGPARGVANIAGARDLFATFYNPAGLDGYLAHRVCGDPSDQRPGRRRGAGSPGSAAGSRLCLRPSRTPPQVSPCPYRGGWPAERVSAPCSRSQTVFWCALAASIRQPHWYMYDSYPDIFIAQMALAGPVL